MLGNEDIDQVDSFTFLYSIISKFDGRCEDVKSRIAKPIVFSSVFFLSQK